MLFMKETKTMTTIYDTELFHELRANPEWETLWTTDASGHYPIPKCGWLPDIHGLDHISSTNKYVTFHGKCHSFRIAPNKGE
jgi:hypothetical protein